MCRERVAGFELSARALGRDIINIIFFFGNLSLSILIT